jgi:hypothetical protein
VPGEHEGGLFSATTGNPTLPAWLGPRVLRADNDGGYTFALFHYAVAGVRLRF